MQSDAVRYAAASVVSRLVQKIKEHEGHISTVTIALGEDRLDAFVTVTSACLTVEDRGVEWPLNLTEPRHAGVLQQI